MQLSLELIHFVKTSSGYIYTTNMGQGPFPSGEWWGLYPVYVLLAMLRKQW